VYSCDCGLLTWYALEFIVLGCNSNGGTISCKWKGALGVERFSEEVHCGGPVGRVPLLGTLEDMLRKALDMGISLYRGPTGEPRGDSLAGTSERKG
jgi:hypothetical protein